MPSIKTDIVWGEGEKVIIRTVTHYYTGRVVAVDERWVALDDCAWIASTDRWSQALATGKLDEVEPYPDGDVVTISLGAIVDVAPWRHDLPRTVK